LTDALQREVAEETGYKIRVDDLFAVGEVAATDGNRRRLVMFFRAGVVAAGKASPTLREQLDVFDWLTREKLASERFHPSHLLPLLFDTAPRPSYLGDITDSIQ
jgi:ADP-ribose pyrophosphatase YjhB (NUDIX family)